MSLGSALTTPHRSEVDDINLGLEHFYGNFNAVHARMIAAGVHQF